MWLHNNLLQRWGRIMMETWVDDIEESFDDDDDERDLNFVIDVLGECPLL